MLSPKVVRALTYHGRLGKIKNAFKYHLDYFLIPMDENFHSKYNLFSFNSHNIISLRDSDYGKGVGSSYCWAKETAESYGIDCKDHSIWLLTQPRVLGFVFNPVSFWFFVNKSEKLIAVIAEVNNTFGDRHCYICFHDDYRPIEKDDRIQTQKIFHVSPFQKIEGQYQFRFFFSRKSVGVWIDYKRSGQEGLFASITGKFEKMTDWSIFRMLMRYPFGSMRVVALIYWQAIKLSLKGAKYKDRPTPPLKDVSR